MEKKQEAECVRVALHSRECKLEAAVSRRASSCGSSALASTPHAPNIHHALCVYCVCVLVFFGACLACDGMLLPLPQPIEGIVGVCGFAAADVAAAVATAVTAAAEEGER